MLDRVVALKVLQDRPNGQGDVALAELFRHEARVAAKLSHPHIITIHDFGIEGASEFLTMQLIDGPSLEGLIHDAGPLPPRVALDLLAQAADALGYAHQAGVIHLDVKPGNILLQQTRRLGQRLRMKASSLPFGLTHPHAVLTDFTISRIRHANARRTSTPQACATVPYASPEQLQQPIETLLPTSDLFSLGVVFHEMLTGKRLFAAPTPEIAHELVLHAAIPPPSVLAPAVAPAVDQLCLRLLERDPLKRLPSAAEVVATAEEILDSQWT